MVLMVGLHMAQVFLAGSYKYPREMNWMTGVLLLVFTLGMGFTGQLLRWDQNATWSVVVGAEQAGRAPVIGEYIARFILGGDTIGGATLSRFFAIHVFLIPAMIFLFLGIHLYLVMRHGISEPPVPGELVDPKTYREGVRGAPAQGRRAVLARRGVARRGLRGGGGRRDHPARRDPRSAGARQAAGSQPDRRLAAARLVPALVLRRALADAGRTWRPRSSWGRRCSSGGLLFSAPFLSNRGERSARRRPWAVAMVVVTVLMIGSLWIVGAKSDWSPNFKAEPLSAAIVGATTGPVADGARLFHDKGCINCHLIEGQGGRRGPEPVAHRRSSRRSDEIVDPHLERRHATCRRSRRS